MVKDLGEKARLYERLYNAMMSRYFDEDFDASFRMAESLLQNADLPVIFRARCYMLLSTTGQEESGAHTNFLHYAHSAVNFLQDARNQGVVIRDETIEEAKNLLVLAEADHNAHTKAGLYAQDEEVEEAAAKGEEVEEAAAKGEEVAQTGDAQASTDRPKKKVRRVHSGDTDPDAPVEVFDEVIGDWRPRGPVEEGEDVEFVN